ncbi:ATP-binding protein [Nonomuraea sp. NPDC049421]|uniref:ATP-binding protein n=1 Tax=Nonomuraea sp. NPDC049421 TaxID=3155275 RepID=UPI003428909E
MRMAAEIPDVDVWRHTTLRRNDRISWQARQATGLWLVDSHPALRADALQVVAELVANAVRHVPGGRRRGWVTVRLGFGDGFVRVQVIDPGARRAVPCFGSQTGTLEESGRGLGIVAALSIRYGTEVLGRGHRVVWADLAAIP